MASLHVDDDDVSKITAIKKLPASIPVVAQFSSTIMRSAHGCMHLTNARHRTREYACNTGNVKPSTVLLFPM